MNSKNILAAALASACAASVFFSLAQAPDRQPSLDRRAGGAGLPPPDQFRGGPGGPPMMFGGQELELVSRFDKNNDGWLNQDERKAAREDIKQQSAQGRGGRQFGGGRFGGPRGPGGEGQNRKAPTPGEKISPANVKTFAGEPLYASNIVRTLFLDFENSDWEKELSDFHNTDVEVPVKLTVDGKTYNNVGVHFRGMSSYMGVPEGFKRSLNLSLDMANKEQNLGGYRTLNLLNAHEDPTYLRPVLFYDIAREYIPAPKANFVRVVINGEDWGIYNNVQQFNKDFVKENFGTTKGARWKVRGSPGGQGSLAYLGPDPEPYKRTYTIKTKDDPKVWASFINMIRVLNETPAENLEKELAPLLDIDGALKFIALDNALINNDGYWIRTSDYSIYQDEKGKFHIIPQDANETFARPGGPGGPGGMRMITPAFMLVRGFFDEGDENQDRQLTSKELASLAENWYTKLDASTAGKLSRAEFETEMQKILPQPRFGFRGPPGAAGEAPPNEVPPPPQNRPTASGVLFDASDTDKDGSLKRDELKSTFTGWLATWDTNKNSTLDEEELRNGLTPLLPPPPMPGPDQFRGGPGGPGGFGGGPGGPNGGPGPQMRMMPGPGRNMPPVDGVKLDPLVVANDQSKPLISKLLAVPALRERYLKYVREIAEKNLDWNTLGPRAEGYHKMLEEYVKLETRKLDTYEAFQKALTEDVSGRGDFGRIGIGLKPFADQRREYLLNYKEKK